MARTSSRPRTNRPGRRNGRCPATRSAWDPRNAMRRRSGWSPPCIELCSVCVRYRSATGAARPPGWWRRRRSARPRRMRSGERTRAANRPASSQSRPPHELSNGHIGQRLSEVGRVSCRVKPSFQLSLHVRLGISLTSNAVRLTAIRAPLRTDLRADLKRLLRQHHYLACREPNKDFEETHLRRKVNFNDWTFRHRWRPGQGDGGVGAAESARTTSHPFPDHLAGELGVPSLNNAAAPCPASSSPARRAPIISADSNAWAGSRARRGSGGRTLPCVSLSRASPENTTPSLRRSCLLYT